MTTIYVYVLDTLADWELGHILPELQSRRFFKEGAQELSIKKVSHSKEPITTMGGISISPDCTVDEMVVEEKNMLLLPGGDTWSDPKHGAVIAKAEEFLSRGAVVGAICGATVALAHSGLLDERAHTSNGAGFLQMVCPTYRGENHYIDEPSVTAKNLITASSTGALLWTKQILEKLGVFAQDTLNAWYRYFCTGEPEQFFALMQSLPKKEN